MTDPRDVVVALLRATETGDPEQVVAHMADDVVWQNVPLPPARGKATVAKQLRAFACLKGLVRAAVKTAQAELQPVGR